MNKQEEIREGIRKRYLARWSSAIEDDVAEGMQLDAKEFTRSILKYLHSEGVVIKVERAWLPNTIDAKTGYIKTPADMANDMLKAGYVAVEPLIKE